MKKKLLQILILGAVFLVNNQLQAQTKNVKDSTSTSTDDDEDDEEMQAVIKEKERLAKQMATDSTKKALKIVSNSTNSKKGLGIGLVSSTNGLGGHLSYSFLPSGKLIGRLEGTYLNYNLKDFSYKFGKTSMLINGPLKFGSVGLYADWHPFGNSFKLTGGFAYMLNNISTIAYLKDSTKQGDIIIAPEEVGSIIIELKPNAIAPYIGLGFGRAVPKHRVGVSFEMGVFYIGEPDVKFVTTGMLTPTGVTEEKKLREGMNELKWLPKLSLSINIKLTK